MHWHEPNVEKDMSGYRKIAVAIDLSSESAAIMKRARDVAAPDSEIHLVYVQEPMDSVYMGVVPYGPVFVGMDEVDLARGRVSWVSPIARAL